LDDWIIKYWLEALFASVTAVIGYALKRIWTKQKQQTVRQLAMEDGLKALLHDRIYQSYVDCEHKGFASLKDLENMGYLYPPYSALGGNGTGAELFERMKKMPVDPAERGHI